MTKYLIKARELEKCFLDVRKTSVYVPREFCKQEPQKLSSTHNVIKKTAPLVIKHHATAHLEADFSPQ